jgi:predicted nucleic acid-binding protein
MAVVIDTNVVFEGLTRQGGACGLVVDAWLAGLFRPNVSTALAFEYADVLGRKLSARRWAGLSPVLSQMLSLAEYTAIHFSWRPASPDPGDDLVVDCAMNANAPVITVNVRDYRLAQKSLGLIVMTPAEFLARLDRVLARG